MRRQEALSEFVHDLRHPSPRYLTDQRRPLLERNPLLFWQGVSFLMVCTSLLQLVLHWRGLY